MDYLEVLDGGLGDPAVEVEHMGRTIFIPHRRLVLKFNQIFHAPILVPYQQAVKILQGIIQTQIRKKTQTKGNQVLHVGLVLLSLFNYHEYCVQFRYSVKTLCIEAGDSGRADFANRPSDYFTHMMFNNQG